MLEGERTIIRLAQNGDSQAFGDIYDTYYAPIYGFVLNRVKNVEIAKDITSEIFFQSLKNLFRFQIRKGISIKSWLFAIAVAQVNSYFRKRSGYLQVAIQECPEIVAPTEEQPQALLEEKEDKKERSIQMQELKKHILSLNIKQQNVLHLRYFSKLSVFDIAQIMNMKEGTVKSHIHRGIKKLQVLMNKEIKKESKQYARKAITNKCKKTVGIHSG